MCPALCGHYAVHAEAKAKMQPLAWLCLTHLCLWTRKMGWCRSRRLRRGVEVPEDPKGCTPIPVETGPGRSHSSGTAWQDRP